MSASQGFGNGFGCVFGVVVAGAIVLGLLFAANKVVTPCRSCSGTGNCSLCDGTGKGIFYGDCMKCGGKKRCPDCGGVGFKSR